MTALVLRRRLQRAGAHVVGATNGHDALAILRKKAHETPYAAVVVDWHLESMGGDGMLNATAWLERPPPVIALTWDRAEQEDALTLGAAAAIVWPVGDAQLRNALRAAPQFAVAAAR